MFSSLKMSMVIVDDIFPMVVLLLPPREKWIMRLPSDCMVAPRMSAKFCIHREYIASFAQSSALAMNCFGVVP